METLFPSILTSSSQHSTLFVEPIEWGSGGGVVRKVSHPLPSLRVNREDVNPLLSWWGGRLELAFPAIIIPRSYHDIHPI